MCGSPPDPLPLSLLWERNELLLKQLELCPHTARKQYSALRNFHSRCYSPLSIIIDVDAIVFREIRDQQRANHATRDAPLFVFPTILITLFLLSRAYKLIPCPFSKQSSKLIFKYSRAAAQPRCTMPSSEFLFCLS